MRRNKIVILLLSTMFLFACNEDAPVTELQFGKNVGGANSAESFRNTLHPLLIQRCGTCHGDGGSNIKHAVSDYKEAHDVVVDGGKVDFSSPVNSRLVDKVASQRHNCWDNDCNASAQQMLAAIEKWIELRGAGPSLVQGATTENKIYGDAVKMLPETINGFLVMQAEDGKLSGRMKAQTSSTASGFTYISGQGAPRHPIEGTARTSSVNGACRDVTPADLSDTVTGRYRIAEPRRHINQQGYRYYSQRVRFRVIRPDMRAAYHADIMAGNTDVATLRKYFLTDGNPDDDNPAQLAGTVQLDPGGALRVLPEFRDHAYWAANINSQNTNFSDFFAPKHGASNIDYFLANNEEIRSNLQSYLKQYIVYNKLRSRFLEYFYDNNGATPEDNIRAIPPTMRTKPTGTCTVFQEDSQVCADEFMAYYFPLADRTAAMAPVSGSDSTPVLETYIHYFMDPADRDFADFSWSYNGNTDSFDLAKGNTNLDLSAILADSSVVDSRAIMASNYNTTLLPVVRANCAGCHGDGSGRPQFASPNNATAFNSMVNFINFATPGNSRPATRMDEGHNCGSNCAAIKAEMVSAINTWNANNTTAIEAAQSTPPSLKALSEAERTPARAVYEMNITEAGSYNVWLKVMTTNNARNFRLRILDEQRREIDVCTSRNNDCSSTPSTTQNRHCEDWNTGTQSEWTWYTPSVNDLDGRRQWNLAVGKYYLEIIESSINAKIDMVAVSKNPEFNPRKNLIDEGLITSAEPRYLKYDISSLINSPGVFEIEVIEKNGGDSYEFRNPRISGNTKNIKVKNIKLLINDKYEFNDSAYTKVDAVVGTDKRNLTNSPLVALAISGIGLDQFKFVFEDLRVTDANETVIEDDVPVAVEGRQCLNLALFENTVMPILNRFRLMRKDDDGYTDYTSDSGQYPGTNRNGGSNPQFYTCTTCHTEEHPYFKMTTFFDQPEVLCAQALSRVDFGNFERSLLLRGINGTFNHPKLHFVESVDLTGSGNSRRFRTNANKVNGFDSSWAGQRFEKYVNSSGGQPHEINLGAYSGADRVYLEKFVGQYQRAREVRINDPFSVRDGDVRLPGDSYDSMSMLVDKWTYASSGRNMVNIVDPEDFVNNKAGLNPDSVTNGGILRVKDSCINVNFANTNGITTDPCNSDIDVTTEFEVIKTRYREAVMNWMQEEKRSYDNR